MVTKTVRSKELLTHHSSLIIGSGPLGTTALGFVAIGSSFLATSFLHWWTGLRLFFFGCFALIVDGFCLLLASSGLFHWLFGFLGRLFNSFAYSSALGWFFGFSLFFGCGLSIGFLAGGLFDVLAICASPLLRFGLCLSFSLGLGLLSGLVIPV
jgi:hypothetical protein